MAPGLGGESTKTGPYGTVPPLGLCSSYFQSDALDLSLSARALVVCRLCRLPGPDLGGASIELLAAPTIDPLGLLLYSSHSSRLSAVDLITLPRAQS